LPRAALMCRSSVQGDSCCPHAFVRIVSAGDAATCADRCSVSERGMGMGVRATSVL